MKGKPGPKRSLRPYRQRGFTIYEDQDAWLNKYQQNASAWMRVVIDNAIKARTQK